MMRSLRIAAVGAFAALAVAACSSNDNSGTSTPTTENAPPAATTTSGGGAATTTDSGGGTAATATITIQNFQFGQPLQVKPGATVTVTNMDTAGHNVVSDDKTSFKTDTLQQGQSATFTAPTKPGTYKFSCTLHTNMTGTGTLVVQG